MTPRQTAVAAAADLKWLTNSASLLGRRLRYTAEAARWWGLVRLLVDDLGLTLKAAADAATIALKTDKAASAPVTDYGAVRIEVDRSRYESIFLANLSRALNHETPRRRGRMRQTAGGAIGAARRYGVDIGLLRSLPERQRRAALGEAVKRVPERALRVRILRLLRVGQPRVTRDEAEMIRRLPGVADVNVTEGGTSALKTGSSFFTPSVTSMVLVPGWRCIPSTIARKTPSIASTRISIRSTIPQPKAGY